MLIRAGFLGEKAGKNGKGADGFFGPRTADAVEKFQAENGLPQTGKLDQGTLDKLGLSLKDDGDKATAGARTDRAPIKPGEPAGRPAPGKVTEAPAARPGAKKVHEDEVPMKTPGGATLVDYNGKGSGSAVYSDGSVYDGNGWQPKKVAVSDARHSGENAGSKFGDRKVKVEGPAGRPKVKNAPATNPSGSKATKKFEDGSAIYEDGTIFDPETGEFRKPQRPPGGRTK